MGLPCERDRERVRQDHDDHHRERHRKVAQAHPDRGREREERIDGADEEDPDFLGEERETEPAAGGVQPRRGAATNVQRKEVEGQRRAERLRQIEQHLP